MLSCPEAKGCRQKDSKLAVLWYRQSWVVWGHWVFWGRMEKIFHFIVVKFESSKLCILGCRQSWVFWGSWVFCGRLEKVFYFIAVSCPKAKACRQKDSKLGILLYRQSWVFLGQLGIFLGGMEIVFYFIVVPCCPMSQKPRDVDKKTPSWVFCCVDRAGYFWGSWVF